MHPVQLLVPRAANDQGKANKPLEPTRYARGSAVASVRVTTAKDMWEVWFATPLVGARRFAQ